MGYIVREKLALFDNNLIIIIIITDLAQGAKM